MTTFEGRSAPLFLAVALAAVILIGALFWGRPEVPRIGWDNRPKGRSALDYGALVSWLDSEGLGAEVSHSHTAAKIGPDDVVLVLEPSVEGIERREWVDELLTDYWTSSRLIVVLPKWKGRPDQSHPGWIESVRWVDQAEPEAVLTLLFEIAATGGRWADSESQAAPDGSPTKVWDWDAEEAESEPPTGEGWPPTILRSSGSPPRHLGTDAPATIENLQMMSGPGSRWLPVIENDEGVLAAFIAEDFLVISDPDLLNNAGIGQGENAALVRDLLYSMVEPEAVWVDESVHGAPWSSSVWGELFRFPLLLVTLHLFVLFALSAWAATQRFGPARPVEPRFHRGKELFLTHTAELLQLAGHGGDSLVRYLALAEMEVARALGWGDLPLEERRKRLVALRGSGERGDDFSSLAQDVNALTVREITPGGVLRMAQRIDHWRRGAVSGRRFDGAG